MPQLDGSAISNYWSVPLNKSHQTDQVFIHINNVLHHHSKHNNSFSWLLVIMNHAQTHFFSSLTTLSEASEEEISYKIHSDPSYYWV